MFPGFQQTLGASLKPKALPPLGLGTEAGNGETPVQLGRVTRLAFPAVPGGGANSDCVGNDSKASG